MSLFDKLFGRSKAFIEEPDVRFGRFSDSYKSDEKYDAWDEALKLFEEDKYLESIKKFLFYLSREDKGNVKIIEENGKISFEILQGSKLITGVADNKKFRAEAKIAQCKQPNIGLMRRLMDKNYALKYSKYAFDKEGNITMVFDTYLLDGSPYKLYYALKELAINSDKQDDILIDEFKSLKAINTGHIKEVETSIKEIKYKYLIREIKRTFDEVDNGKLNFGQYPGAATYLYLDLIYRLDYLIVPEGNTMENIETIHHAFFAKDRKSAGHKNKAIRKDIEKILKRKKTDFFAELYEITSTFGVTMSGGHERLTAFIDGEIGNMDWYQKHNHLAVALSVPGYIVGYALFNYALPAPDRDFLHLYLRIMENDYFRNFGFTHDFILDGNIIEKEVKKAIYKINKKHVVKFPKLNPDVKVLKYNSKVDFAKSYIMMLRKLDISHVVRDSKS